MSDNTFTEVTHTGWFSRIGSAIMGVIFGLIMFLLAFPLLFWNEGRAVDRIKALDEGAAAVISVQSDQIISANDNVLIHLSGLADTKEILSDPTFKVSSNALKLRREVLVYQWQEETSTRTEKKLGGGEKKVTEYKYTKGWDNDLADSSSFKKPEYKNPNSTAYNENEYQAQSVSLNAFKLPNSLVRKINNYKAIEVATDTQLTLAENQSAMLYQGGYYIGKDPAQPEIGDLRISFSQVLPEVVSIVAQQTGSTLQNYSTETGDILLLEHGEVSAESMFQTAMTENTVLTWVLRLAGLIVMAIGLSLIMRPISVLADVVPIFGNIAEAGIGIISILIALVLSFITVSLAWIWFRPLVGGLLLLISLGCAWLLKSRFKAKTSSKNDIGSASDASLTIEDSAS
jgi:hypothetical protein